nr:unnamed protein product [Digitaria exilis]
MGRAAALILAILLTYSCVSVTVVIASQEAQRYNFRFVRHARDAPALSYYNYIVVGGGTAGCPLAATLSEHSRVLLLERGGLPYGNRNVSSEYHFADALADTSPLSPAQRFVSEDGVGRGRGRGRGNLPQNQWEQLAWHGIRKRSWQTEQTSSSGGTADADEEELISSPSSPPLGWASHGNAPALPALFSPRQVVGNRPDWELPFAQPLGEVSVVRYEADKDADAKQPFILINYIIIITNI